MNRRTYLQTLGAAVGTATLASTGAAAAEGDDLPEAVRQAPVGASNAKVSNVPDDVIDVRDHGAQLDGSHDDRGAIQSAADEAAKSGTPDTVYCPAGTLRVSRQVRLYSRHSGVTIQGIGSETYFRLDGGQTSNASVFKVDSRSGGSLTDLTIRDLRIDCQNDKQSDIHIRGITSITGSDGDDNNLVENVWIQDGIAANCLWNIPGTTLRSISSWGAKKWHGIALQPEIDHADRPIVIEDCHVRENEVHGINSSGGHSIVRNTLSEENGWGGKNTSNVDSCTWQNVVFRNNKYHGYMIPLATNGPITFDNVVAEGNGRSGFRFNEDAVVEVGTIAARANDATGQGSGNVYIGGSVEVDADTIYSFDSYTDGLVFDNYNGGPSGSIDTYVHGGNDRDVIRGDRGSDFSLGTVKQGEYPDIDPLGGKSVESLDSGSATSAGLPVTDGLVLSLDASAGVSTSDGQVTGWADQSGQGNDLTANGDPALTTAPSGAQAIHLDGSDDKLVRTGPLSGLPTGSKSRSVVTVAKYESTGFGGVTYGSPSWNDTFGPVVNDEGELTVQGWGHSNDYSSGVTGTGAGWLTQSVVYDGSQFIHYRNGQQIDSGTHSFSTKSNKLVIGAELDTLPYLDMQVGAVAVYDRPLSDTERKEVEQHLRSRYLSNS